MLTESFLAATLTANKPVQHSSSALRDVGIFLREFQPQNVMRQGYKKSSVQAQCLAVSESHIFAAQAEKAVVNVYSREKGNQEATVPFPERVQSLAYADGAGLLVLGTDSGKLIMWEVATGRLSNSTASHMQSATHLCITPNNDYILSGSPDSSVHVWSLPNLVSFAPKANVFSNDRVTNTPLHTFTKHRDPITALSCGHSQHSTNFAVSGSEDRTCYVWHIASGELLRTILLTTAPLCAIIDPVDRAIFFGDEHGDVTFVDLLNLSIATMQSLEANSGPTPIQLAKQDTWKPPSAQVGAIRSLILSYDGTALLSGHANGSIMQWDVAKRRVATELANLGQPVTCIEMLTPSGFQMNRPAYVISAVVKPKLEFSAQTENGTCNVPASYKFHVSLTASQRSQSQLDADDPLTGPGWPTEMLDDAVRALDVGSAQPTNGSGSQQDLAKTERLQEEVSILQQQLAALRDVEEQRKARRMQRMARREELGAKKREAYFEAKKKGKDGDAAMKAWEEKEAMVDVESDDEYLGDGMDVR